MAGMGEKQGVQVVLENGAPGIAAVHPVPGDTVEPDGRPEPERVLRQFAGRMGLRRVSGSRAGSGQHRRQYPLRPGRMVKGRLNRKQSRDENDCAGFWRRIPFS